MIKFRELKHTESEIKKYHDMRCGLYIVDNMHEKHDEQDLYEEMILILKGKCFYKNELSWHIFVAANEEDDLLGFIEITIYPELFFCNSKPVGYIESWYVNNTIRHQGVGKGLVTTAEEWLKHNNILEIASDVEIWNNLSHIAHKSIGFKESHTEDGCIFYRKHID